jgi:predicted GNAT family acetyltransferase
MNEQPRDKEIAKTIVSNLFEHSFCLSSHPRYESYICRFFAGELIATGVLFQETAEVAGIYLVATLPSARKRGIATAMMEHLLLESWRKGCRHVVLLANSQGYGVYHRLGFKDNCTLKIYTWQPL